MTKHGNPVQDIAEAIWSIYDSGYGDAVEVLRAVLEAFAMGISAMTEDDARARAWRQLRLTAEAFDGQYITIGSGAVVDRSRGARAPAPLPETEPDGMITIFSVPPVSIVTRAPVVAEGDAPADPRLWKTNYPAPLLDRDGNILADPGIPPERIEDAYRRARRDLDDEVLAPFAAARTPEEDTP